MKVVFNIKKLQVLPITATDDNGVPTYGDVLKLPGTVSLQMDNESTTDPFYADGIAYYAPAGATSATGTLENALFTNAVLKAIYRYIEDSNGNLIETDEAPREFGMQFAADSDEGEVYFTYYRVSSTKPGLNLQTNEASATINPQSVDITASTVSLSTGQNILKSFCTSTMANYATYMDTIALPVVNNESSNSTDSTDSTEANGEI